MMRACVAWGAFLVVVAAVTPGRADKIPEQAKAVLDKADQLEFYSLDPNTNDDKGFHGYKVLGHTAIKKEDRAKLVTAFEKGVADNKGMAAACFIPRHGLRAIGAGGKTVDFVICFECLQVNLFINDKDAKGFLITGSPQLVFDKVLKDAKVPLPKK